MYVEGIYDRYFQYGSDSVLYNMIIKFKKTQSLKGEFCIRLEGIIQKIKKEITAYNTKML
ncbi:hypothetical protein CN950_23120 [Bacillus cereus]|nr:hypothetical protein CN407_02740 [Bacillus cereus]PGM62753.1 hypothetical protein CN950_23120 [Bacillus cereus]